MRKNFTPASREVVKQARLAALKSYNDEVTPGHLALALMEHPAGWQAFSDLRIPKSWLRETVHKDITRGIPWPMPDKIPFNAKAKHLIRLANAEAIHFGDEFVSPEHIVLGMIRDNECDISRALNAFGIDHFRARQVIGRHATYL